MTTMTFDEAISYVKSLDVYGSVLGLDNMHALADYLDNPQDGLKFVHVTGTNGKGSTSAFIASIFMEAGYTVGTYNSPSVKSDIDQFRINMNIVSKDLYAEAVGLVKDACDKMIADGCSHPTRFEVETMASFVMFYITKCDIVVLETGLGGAYDATNIITTAVLHVITSISMDHAYILGDTLEKIAENKSGIIKTSAPVVLYDRGKNNESTEYAEVNKVFINKCRMMGSELYMVSDLDLDKDLLSMKGAYQSENASLAIKAAEVLIDMGYRISEDDIYNGLKKAKIPFRFEQIKTDDQVDIILDGAHNPDGAVQLVKSLELNYPDRKFIFVTGIFKDKDYNKIAEITGKKADKIYVIENKKSARSLDKNILADTFRQYNDNVLAMDSLYDALTCAISEAKTLIMQNGTHPVVCCYGSLSWLNDAKQMIKDLTRRS